MGLDFEMLEMGEKTIDELDIDYRYKVELDRVIDGDTYDFIVDLGFKVFTKIRVRLKDYDAPELRGEERERGLAMKKYIEYWMKNARQIAIDSYKTGKYGRWLADIYLDGIDIKEILKGFKYE